jgi:hypothetical protein
MSETKQREEQRELERQVEELKRIFNAIELSIKKGTVFSYCVVSFSKIAILPTFLTKI